MASDLFLKLDAIPGESTDARHRDEIEVLSWSWDESSEAALGHGGGAGVGRVTLRDFHFTHRVDRSSPLLMTACATGRHIRTATFTARRGGESPLDHLIVTLDDVSVGSVAVGGSEGDEGPTEGVSLRFGRIQVDYRPQLADGSLGEAVVFTADRSGHP